MKLFSFTTLLVVLLVAYLINAIWTIYHLWNPESCQPNDKNCLWSHIHKRKDIAWNMKAYVTPKKEFSPSSSTLIWTWKNINFEEDKTKLLNVTLPPETANNGSLFLYMFLYPKGDSAFSGQNSFRITTAITEYQIPVSFFKLMNNDTSQETRKAEKVPTTHWRPSILLYVMTENFLFSARSVPSEFMHLLRVTPQHEYLPIFCVDEMSHKKSDLKHITKGTKEIELEIVYSPIGVGKLRFWLTMTASMQAMKNLGFSDSDLDDIKGIFTDTNLIFLGLTIVVSVFHLLFDFLAFKNDINYWKKRKTMAGLSFHTVVYRCVSTIIIFFYLFDQKTSFLVLIPAGVGSVIEIWKVTKALKVTVEWSGWKPNVSFGTSSDMEKTTKDFDQQAIKYLSYVLYPLCIGAAVYSLFYVPHKSWYSWIVQSLVNGVYAFGFLFMLPQLFINYKLKSVAHLPWRAFMYKAFNTFIDDIFAFIIKMPTSHRLACFRDDIVFFCYLYQLWLYPVDKTRPNEYGISYEDEHEKKD
ncbi:lipid scramblase CLPTM1L-like [Clavelina lepadiformis]|uniref:lipid scramblase CLPTM1L-like n=1 Tax=Clavelina lepadiformis TaxID=159417 RepID=UPI0040413E61